MPILAVARAVLVGFMVAVAVVSVQMEASHLVSVREQTNVAPGIVVRQRCFGGDGLREQGRS